MNKAKCGEWGLKSYSLHVLFCQNEPKYQYNYNTLTEKKKKNPLARKYSAKTKVNQSEIETPLMLLDDTAKLLCKMKKGRGTNWNSNPVYYPGLCDYQNAT